MDEKPHGKILEHATIAFLVISSVSMFLSAVVCLKLLFMR